MNEQKLNRIFDLARGDTPPAAPEGFDARVLSAIRREQRAAPVSLWEQLGELFPRLAVAAMLVMGTCLAAEFYLSATTNPRVNGDLTALSEQWHLGENGE
jgi:hypothetical protein